jgi:hypothetical protein
MDKRKFTVIQKGTLALPLIDSIEKFNKKQRQVRQLLLVKFNLTLETGKRNRNENNFQITKRKPF